MRARWRILLALFLLQIGATRFEAQTTSHRDTMRDRRAGQEAIEQLFAAWSSHEADKVVAYYTDDIAYEDVPLGRTSHGKAELRRFVEDTFAAFPDLKVEVVSISICRGHGVSEVVWSATDKGFLKTDKRFSIRMVSVFELHEGKVARNKDFYDLATIMRQLGALPADSAHADIAKQLDDSAGQKEIENQIIALEKRLWNGDANEVSKLEAEDYEVIKHAHRYHRADDEAAAKDVKFALVSMDDIRVRMLRSDVALITYHATQKGSFRGKEVPPSLYFGSIWVNKGGEWKNVFLEENLPDAFTDVYKPISEPADGEPRP